MLARNLPRSHGQVMPYGAATILVSKSPLSAADVSTLEGVARELQFDVVLAPGFAPDPDFAALVSANGSERLAANLSLNLAPPTDDQPFFFNMIRLRDIFRGGWRYRSADNWSLNLQAVFILMALFAIVFILTLLCIIVPLLRNVGTQPVRGALPDLLFFAAIGFGFMLIEVSQIQRLTMFLGHPTYGLSVSLFTLLLSSGLGSYSTQAPASRGSKASGFMLMLSLLGVLALIGSVSPVAIHAFSALTTPKRILVAMSLVFPLGFVMGTAFPLGLELASLRSQSLTPWLWGVNGATSVCGSVLAVMVSLSSGISSCFWTGVLFYCAAFGAFAWPGRQPVARPVLQQNAAA